MGTTFIWNSAPTNALSVNTGGGALTIGRLDQANGSAAGKTVTLNSGTGTTAFTGLVDGAYGLTANAGSFTFNSAWGGTTPLNNVSLTSANTSFSMPNLTSTGNVALNAGTGTITTGTIATGNGNLTLTADDLAIGGNLSGTGTLTLKPSTASRKVNINYGSADGTNLNLSTAEVAFLTDGWNAININQYSGYYAGATLSVGASNWTDPINLYSNDYTNGYGAVTGTGNASIFFGSRNNFGVGNITTQGGNVGINVYGGGITPGSFNVITNGGNFTSANYLTINGSGAMSINTGGGSLTAPGISNNGNNGGNTITLNAGSGTLTLSGTVNMPTANITTNAGNYSFGGDWGAMTPLGNVSLTSASGLALPSITASSIFAKTTGATSDITLGSGKVLSASGAGNALTLAAGRNFINNAGSGAFSLSNSGAKRWLVYSTDPTGTTGEETLGANFNRYSCTYAGIGTCAANATIGSTVTIPGTGNGLIYSYTPTLTATPTTQTIVYGNATPTLNNYGYSVSGYNTGEGSDSISGTLNGTTTYIQGADVGNYTINYATGALSSALGYAINYANSTNALAVGKAHFDCWAFWHGQ